MRVLAVMDPEGIATGRQIILASLGLLAVSLLPAVMGWTGAVYLVGAVILGLAFVAVGAGQAWEPSALAARRVVLASILYLPLLLCLWAVDRP